jgi:hypothetical protein
MAKFTTRVELHKANSEDYDTLHEEMENQGFTRTIKSDDDKEYHLPEAEYNYEGSITRDSVMTKAKTAANKTGKKYSILITESNGRTWYNLDEV